MKQRLKTIDAFDAKTHLYLNLAYAQIRLTKGTVSAILNNSHVARTIPQRTKGRVYAEARRLNYRPDFFASNLRARRAFAVGVITAEIGDAYAALVISGVEAVLTHHKHFFVTAAHRHDLHNLEKYIAFLLSRGVEGVITCDTILQHPLPVPTVSVSGHRLLKGVTNITLNHDRAAHPGIGSSIRTRASRHCCFAWSARRL